MFEFFTVVNVITQILLNVLLNLVNYYSGSRRFLFCYVLLEMVVFVMEAMVYKVGICKISREQKYEERAVEYALTANVMSFIAGFFIAYFVPGIM